MFFLLCCLLFLLLSLLQGIKFLANIYQRQCQTYWPMMLSNMFVILQDFIPICLPFLIAFFVLFMQSVVIWSALLLCVCVWFPFLSIYSLKFLFHLQHFCYYPYWMFLWTHLFSIFCVRWSCFSIFPDDLASNSVLYFFSACSFLLYFEINCLDWHVDNTSHFCCTQSLCSDHFFLCWVKLGLSLQVPDHIYIELQHTLQILK